MSATKTEDQAADERATEEGSTEDGPEIREVDRTQEVTRAEIRSALWGGLVVAVTLFGVVWSVGKAGDAEAYTLLESATPSLRFLAASVLTVGSTVLALMLTLLGISQSTDRSFKAIHYARIRRVSLMNVIAIVGAILLLLSLSVPLAESDLLLSFYAVVYYVVVCVSSLLGGFVVAMVLMLHRTIKGLSTAASPVERVGPLVQEPQ